MLKSHLVKKFFGYLTSPAPVNFKAVRTLPDACQDRFARVAPALPDAFAAVAEILTSFPNPV
jgi:hypothetical protein